MNSIDAIAGATIKDMRASPDGQYFAVLGQEEKQVLIWKYQGYNCLTNTEYSLYSK